MNRKLVIFFVIVASLAMTAGIAKAAGLTVDWLRVGTQTSGGVTYFNGTIINNTTGTGGTDNPVTFGDNVRIDGRVYRGITAGIGDTLPFIVNDNMQVAGNTEVSGNLTVSGTVTAAKLQQLVGNTVSASGSRAVSAAIAATTWTGNVYYASSGVFTTSATVTVAFSPTTETTGTWSSTPFNAFNYQGGALEPITNGTYNIVENVLFVTYGASTGMSIVNLNGSKIVAYNTSSIPGTVTVLTRQ